jgi:hypothetical protein
VRQGFTVHHNGPPANCVGQPHSRCEAFWRAVRSFHVNDKGWSDIAYSFGVCPHGVRFVGRGWVKHQFANGDDEVGPDDDENGPWYSVLMFVGGGPGTGDPEEMPPPAMDDGLDRLITEGRNSGRCGMRVEPHSKWKRKPCPGPHYTAYCTKHNNRPINPTTPKDWFDMATKKDLEDVIKDLFKDEPGGDSGYATGQIVTRLTRELKAPSSPFRQALVKAVADDLKSLLGQERLELIVAAGVNGAAGDTTDGQHGLGARLDDVGTKLGDLMTRS